MLQNINIWKNYFLDWFKDIHREENKIDPMELIEKHYTFCRPKIFCVLNYEASF